MAPDIYFLVICPSPSSTPKFWHMYVIKYIDFTVMVDPCCGHTNKFIYDHPEKKQ